MNDNYANAAADTLTSSQEVPLFSIVIPIYNVEKWLRLCLESVLNQTYKDYYEVVLVDDGSHDSCPAICDEYKEKYPEKIKVIHQENKGSLKARTNAYINACGRYMVSVDSDDLVSPYLLERVGGAIKDTGADLILYNSERIDLEGNLITKGNKTLKEPQGKIDKETILKDWLSGNAALGSMCIKVFKKELYNFKKFSEDRRFNNIEEDQYQSVDIIANSEYIYYLDETLYYYRVNPESTGHTFIWNEFSLDSAEWFMLLCERAAGLGYKLSKQDFVDAKNYYMSFHERLWAFAALIIKSDMTNDAKTDELNKLRSYVIKIDPEKNFDLSSLPAYKKLGLRLFYSGRYHTLIAYETAIYKTKKLLKG